jgi:hypothetical protein
LALTGALLLVIAGLVVSGSAWTVPLVIAGVLMVVIAWVGSRLDGRLVLEWGESGAKLEFRAEINSAEHQLKQFVPVQDAAPVGDVVPEDAEVIEGEAHTVEIDVAELKALIAVADAALSEPPPSSSATNGSSPSGAMFHG